MGYTRDTGRILVLANRVWPPFTLGWIADCALGWLQVLVEGARRWGTSVQLDWEKRLCRALRTRIDLFRWRVRALLCSQGVNVGAY